jgi:hypothetical protein
MKTDTELQQDVTYELQWEPSIEAAEIGVSVRDGIVTLSGYVDSYIKRWSPIKIRNSERDLCEIINRRRYRYDNRKTETGEGFNGLATIEGNGGN